MNNIGFYFIMLVLSIPLFLMITANMKAIINKKDESKLFFNELKRYSFTLIRKTIFIMIFILSVLFLLSFMIEPLDFPYFISSYIVELIIVAWTLSFFHENSNEKISNETI